MTSKGAGALSSRLSTGIAALSGTGGTIDPLLERISSVVEGITHVGFFPGSLLRGELGFEPIEDIFVRESQRSSVEQREAQLSGLPFDSSRLDAVQNVRQELDDNNISEEEAFTLLENVGVDVRTLSPSAAFEQKTLEQRIESEFGVGVVLAFASGGPGLSRGVVGLAKSAPRAIRGGARFVRSISKDFITPATDIPLSGGIIPFPPVRLSLKPKTLTSLGVRLVRELEEAVLTGERGLTPGFDFLSTPSGLSKPTGLGGPSRPSIPTGPKISTGLGGPSRSVPSESLRSPIEVSEVVPTELPVGSIEIPGLRPSRGSLPVIVMGPTIAPEREAPIVEPTRRPSRPLRTEPSPRRTAPEIEPEEEPEIIEPLEPEVEPEPDVVEPEEPVREPSPFVPGPVFPEPEEPEPVVVTPIEIPPEEPLVEPPDIEPEVAPPEPDLAPSEVPVELPEITTPLEPDRAPLEIPERVEEDETRKLICTKSRQDERTFSMTLPNDNFVIPVIETAYKEESSTKFTMSVL